VEIIRDLRAGEFDVLVGINLLREGLDLPEVSLVAILDADKEGFLRSETSLVQTIGRAARNVGGRVIMYADHITDSMRRAIGETNRRRTVQQEYNARHGITPQTIVKRVKEFIETTKVAEAPAAYRSERLGTMSRSETLELIATLEKEMRQASKLLEFERAAELRDMIIELRQRLQAAAPAGKKTPPRAKTGGNPTTTRRH
jgi:excinuclease ABC subunit B